MATLTCIKCNADVNEGTDVMLRCDGCNRPIHASCSELTPAELKCFNLRSSVKRRVKYLCLECEQGLHQIPKILQLINELKNEIRELKNASSVDVGVTQLDPANSSQSREQIINEAFERTKRSHNFIIHGSVESGASKQDQMRRDTDLVQSVMKECEVEGQNLKPFRIGRFDPTKDTRTRPLKVCLSSPELVHVILRRFRRLKTKFQNINITPDRTPEQTAYYKSVKAELVQRSEAGETNLRMKYISGIPSIVSSTSSSEN